MKETETYMELTYTLEELAQFKAWDDYYDNSPEYEGNVVSINDYR